jgi:hypothetical protein
MAPMILLAMDMTNDYGYMTITLTIGSNFMSIFFFLIECWEIHHNHEFLKKKDNWMFMLRVGPQQSLKT